MVAFDILPLLFSTQEAFLVALDDTYRGIEEDECKKDDLNLLCRCLTGERCREDMEHFVNFTEAVKIDSHFLSTKENCETRKSNTESFLPILFEQMALFCDKYARPELNDHDESDWAGYARTTKTGEEEGDGAAVDQFGGLDLELKIMKLLWPLMDRFCVNNIACGVNELFTLLPTYEEIWTAGKEFLQVPNNPTYHVVDPFLSIEIAGRDVEIYHRDALRDRPIQEKLEESMSVYKPGKGWDETEAQGWFGEKN